MVSSFTSLIDEIEAEGRVEGALVADVETVRVGGFETEDTLLGAVAVRAVAGFLTASEDTAALGRVAVAVALFTDATEPVGDATDVRFAAVSVVVFGLEKLEEAGLGFPLAEEERGALVVAGAEGFAGARDARRAGAAAEVAGARDAMVGLAVAVGPAVDDLLNEDAVAVGFAPIAPPETEVLTVGALFRLPEPNVPELIIFFTKGVGGSPLAFAFPVLVATDIDPFSLVPVTFLTGLGSAGFSSS